MIWHTKVNSREADGLLKRSSTDSQDSETQNNHLSLSSQQEIVKHVTEMDQEIKCTVNELSILKGRIFSIENEIKTLKLFPGFLLK